jgi:hypothetical protein
MFSPLFSARSPFVTQEWEGAEDPKSISIFAEMIVALRHVSAQHMSKFFSRIIARQEM